MTGRDIFLLVVQTIWAILPLGIANMAPVLVKRIRLLEKPLDAGHLWRGQPLFGSHKTWRGLVAATIFGQVIFFILAWLGNYGAWKNFDNLLHYSALPYYTGALLGLGAILGDLVKSFFKRRFGIASGKSWIPFDQIDYLLGGLIALSCVSEVKPAAAILILLFGVILHIIVNHIGYFLGIRETKW